MPPQDTKAHGLLLPVCALAALLLSMPIAGCGGEHERRHSAEETIQGIYTVPVFHPSLVEATGSPAFDSFLLSLKRAALSGHAVHAARKAKKLTGLERAVGEEFCEFTFKVKANRELQYLDVPRYSADQILRYAAYRRKRAFTMKAEAVLKELDSVIDLKSLTPTQVRRYRIACYR